MDCRSCWAQGSCSCSDAVGGSVFTALGQPASHNAPDVFGVLLLGSSWQNAPQQELMQAASGYQAAGSSQQQPFFIAD